MEKEIVTLLRDAIQNNANESRLMREEIHKFNESLRGEIHGLRAEIASLKADEIKPLNDFKSRMLAYVTILGATISAAGTFIVNKLMS